MAERPTGSPRRLIVVALPLIVFAALAGIFAMQLMSGRDVGELPSALIGKPVPAFELPALAGLTSNGVDVPALKSADLSAKGDGRPTLVNIFASWCAPCRAEHPVLMRLAREGRIDVVGINYKDDPENALRFLGALGNPYSRVGTDRNGRTAIEWGFYGIPESFLIDGKGVVRHKIVGPIGRDALDRLNAEIAALEAED